jgi:hypothetical protein
MIFSALHPSSRNQILAVWITVSPFIALADDLQVLERNVHGTTAILQTG